MAASRVLGPMLLACAASGALAACGSDEPTGTQKPRPACDATREACGCPDGFTLDTSGDGCVEIAPADDCPGGTRAALGSATCVPVAMASCAPGMLPDASGWGCLDVEPKAPCSGATMEVLGEAMCQPIGDCTAPFPPADATILVDASYGPSDIDATHFASIGSAAAVAPPNAVIAIEAGTYVEDVTVTKPVTLVGRCAEKVIIESPAGGAPGIESVGVDGVSVKALTLSGHKGGAAANGGSMTVEDCLITQSPIVGVIAVQGADVRVRRTRIEESKEVGGSFGYGATAETHATVELTDCAVVHNTNVGVAARGGTIALHHSIVRETRPSASGAFGKGASAEQGGSLVVDTSAFVNNHAAQISALGHSSVAVASSILRGALPDEQGYPGRGVEVAEGSHGTIDGTTFTANADPSVYVVQPGTSVDVKGCVVRGKETPDSAPIGAGILVGAGGMITVSDTALVGLVDIAFQAQDPDSQATLSGSLIRDTVTAANETPENGGSGLAVAFGAHLDGSDLTVVGNATVGIRVGGADTGGATSTATLDHVLVRGPTPEDAQPEFGRGIEVMDGAQVTLVSTAVADAREASLIAGLPQTRVDARACVFRGTVANANGAFGDGVVALDGATVTVAESTVRDNERVGLLFSNTTGGVDAAVVATNAIGVNAQNGSKLEEQASLPSALAPLSVVVTQATRFVGNESRIGASELPVPTVAP